MGFELTPADVPAQKQSRSSVYDEILDQFLASDLASVRVDGTDIKSTTLASGLRKRSEARKLGVRVIMRKSEVFVARETGESQAPPTASY